MNEKQKEVWEQVKEMLGEHFDAFTLAICANDIDDEGHQLMQISFDGGWIAAFGLAEYTKLRLVADFSASEA